MKKSTKKGQIIIPAGRKPWPHELRVAEILAANGHRVEFLPETNLKTADIRLDGVEYEIKSPFTNKPDKLERNLKRGLKQSKNIIFDSSRTKNIRDDKLYKFLVTKVRQQKQIGRLIFITKRGRIIDISGCFC
jgi:predicted metal-dependent RNase